MTTLYFVALYSHRANEWARILCTADTKEEAIEECESALDDAKEPRLRYWKARTARAICQTPEEIWTEI